MANGTGWIDRDAALEEWPDLGEWAQTQRVERRAGRLSAERIAELNRIGFEWDRPARSQSRETYPPPNAVALLAEWITTNGSGWVPISAASRGWLGLGRWALNQRVERRAGGLTADRIAELDAVGFLWDGPGVNGPRRAKRSSDTLAMLAAWIDQNGTGWVDHNAHVDGWSRFAEWVQQTRTKRRSGRLSAQRIAELDAIGFQWIRPGRESDKFHKPPETLALTAEWIRQNGTGWIPIRATLDGWPSFGKWADNQRSKRKTGLLSAQRVAELDAVGFAWVKHER